MSVLLDDQSASRMALCFCSSARRHAATEGTQYGPALLSFAKTSEAYIQRFRVDASLVAAKIADSCTHHSGKVKLLINVSPLMHILKVLPQAVMDEVTRFTLGKKQ